MRNPFAKSKENYEAAMHWSLLLPPVRLKFILESFAGTDLLTHHDYYGFVQESRKELRRKFLPQSFNDNKIAKEELLKFSNQVPLREFHPEFDNNSIRLLCELGFIGLLFFAFAVFSFMRIERRLQV